MYDINNRKIFSINFFKGETEMTYQTIYPYNGKLLRKYPNATDNDVENTLETAHALYLKWRKQSISLRKNILLKIAEEMRHSRDQLAKDIVYDMGKLLTEAKDEVDLCINIIDYYANHAEKLLQPINLNVPQGKAYYLKQATGVIMAVEPWNFPLYQIVRVFALCA